MRVLVVDDEPAIAESVRTALARDGWATDVVLGGPEAVEWAGTYPYDLIVLDLVLPGIDGLEVCRRLRDAGCPAAILMLTALDEVEQRVAGLDSGADDYLTKPFSMSELLARTRALRRRAIGERHPLIRVGIWSSTHAAVRVASWLVDPGDGSGVFAARVPGAAPRTGILTGPAHRPRLGRRLCGRLQRRWRCSSAACAARSMEGVGMGSSRPSGGPDTGAAMSLFRPGDGIGGSHKTSAVWPSQVGLLRGATRTKQSSRGDGLNCLARAQRSIWRSGARGLTGMTRESRVDFRSQTTPCLQRSSTVARRTSVASIPTQKG